MESNDFSTGLSALWAADPFDALAAIREAERVEAAGAPAAALAWCGFLRAFCALRAGDNDRAALHIGESLVLAGDTSAPNPRVGLLCRYLIAFQQTLRGEHGEALAAFERILADTSGALTEFDRAVVSGNFGTCLWLAGSLQEGARRLFDCMETMRREGRRHRTMVVMTNLVQLLTDLGDLTSAWEIYQELSQMPEAQQMQRTRTALPIIALGIQLARRDYEAAYLALPAAEAMIAEQPLVDSEAQVPPAMAEAYLRHGDVERARQWLARGEPLAPLSTQRRAYARMQQARALLHLHDGESQAARDCAAQAAEILEQDGYLAGWCEALETLAECHEACGEWAQAAATLRRHNDVTRVLANNANQSRHYVLEAQFKFARMREERDHATAQNEMLAKHADQLTDVNRKLEQHLSDVETLRRELAEQAVRDTLTGLYNRRRLQTAWPELQARAIRHGLKVFVALLDIDHFKRINDTYGHATGDEVLMIVAAVLTRSFRPDDLVLRYGGEEFCIVLNALDIESPHERLIAAMDRLKQSEVRDTSPPLNGIAFSAGITMALPDENFDAAARRADALLYRAKAAGRARILAG
jgi:diguanylate cyclase (GGDEF)-like protein